MKFNTDAMNTGRTMKVPPEKYSNDIARVVKNLAEIAKEHTIPKQKIRDRIKELEDSNKGIGDDRVEYAIEELEDLLK